jgi:hypothetical protein
MVTGKNRIHLHWSSIIRLQNTRPTINVLFTYVGCFWLTTISITNRLLERSRIIQSVSLNG